MDVEIACCAFNGAARREQSTLTREYCYAGLDFTKSTMMELLCKLDLDQLANLKSSKPSRITFYDLNRSKSLKICMSTEWIPDFWFLLHRMGLSMVVNINL